MRAKRHPGEAMPRTCHDLLPGDHQVDGQDHGSSCTKTETAADFEEYRRTAAGLSTGILRDLLAYCNRTPLNTPTRRNSRAAIVHELYVRTGR